MDSVTLAPGLPAVTSYAPPSAPRPFVPAGQTSFQGASPAAKAAALNKAADDFEAVFVSQMLESMSAGVETNKTFGGGQAETMFRSMMNQEYGKAIAKSGSLGIASSIRAAMLHMQEMANK